MIRYADIVYDTIVDGDGLRNTLYVSGCSHNCLGCHNKALQDYNYGKSNTWQEIVCMLTVNNNDITISGGEPFEQAEILSKVLFQINCQRDKKVNFWVYSGYTFEQIINDQNKLELLKLCDVLVDGKFEIDKQDTSLLFRGSSNQRIIDVQKSLEENEVILWRTTV